MLAQNAACQQLRNILVFTFNTRHLLNLTPALHLSLSFTTYMLTGHCISLSAIGVETSDPGGSRWFPVCSGGGDWSGDLRIGLCDASAEPSPVGVVWQHPVRAGPSR